MKRSTIIASTFVCLSVGGCASHHVQMVVDAEPVGTPTEYLKKHIKRIDIKNEDMPALIFELGNKIASATGQVQSISWRGSEYIPARVTYHAENITVTELFDAIEAQTGWKYRVTPLGIVFDPPNPRVSR